MTNMRRSNSTENKLMAKDKQRSPEDPGVVKKKSRRAPTPKSQAYGKWEQIAWEKIYSEMTNRGISYGELSTMLKDLKIKESADQINRKVNRKLFSAAFLLACMHAMGVESISLKDE